MDEILKRLEMMRLKREIIEVIDFEYLRKFVYSKNNKRR